MSAPKHLWSGNWEEESAAAGEALAGRRGRARPADEAPTEPSRPRPRPATASSRPSPPAPHADQRHRSPAPDPRPRRPPRDPGSPGPARSPLQLSPAVRRIIPIAVAALLILAAGAYGLNHALSNGQPQQPSQGASNQPSGPTSWLGMQLESVTPGSVVIETIAPGSPAELAGLEPGDVIDEINGQPISSTSQIGPAVASLPPGSYVEIQVNRGSTQVTTQAALTGQPNSHP